MEEKPKPRRFVAPKGNKFSPGAPSLYQKKFDKQAYKLCLLGATDLDLANFFEVEQNTINTWKLKYKSFQLSIKEGKETSDMEVAQSLYKSCKDRTIIEEVVVKTKNPGPDAGETIEVIRTKKTIPGDFRSQQFWLRNRKSTAWKDKQDIDISGTIKLGIIEDEDFK